MRCCFRLCACVAQVAAGGAAAQGQAWAPVGVCACATLSTRPHPHVALPFSCRSRRPPATPPAGESSKPWASLPSAAAHTPPCQPCAGAQATALLGNAGCWWCWCYSNCCSCPAASKRSCSCYQCAEIPGACACSALQFCSAMQRPRQFPAALGASCTRARSARRFLEFIEFLQTIIEFQYLLLRCLLGL